MDPTWQIIPDDLTGDVYASDDDAVVSAAARIDSGMFGHGLLRPFRRDGNGDFASGNGAALIRSAVGLVLMTTCSSKNTTGELPWRTDFGSLLEMLRLRNNDGRLNSVIKRYVVDALERWIPAIDVTDVVIVAGHRNRLFLKLTYDVVDPGGARVLVPGLQTAVPVG